MRPSHRILLGFLVARLVFGLAFLAGGVAHWPLPWYVPLRHAWVWSRTAPGVAMDWYARSLFSLALAAVAGGATYAAAGVASWSGVMARRGVVNFVAHFGALMLLNDVLFYVLSLATRHPVPVPLPGWYCAR